MQLHCLKLQISNPNILKTVTNTKNCQLRKFLKNLSSLQKCLFEVSATKITKVTNCFFIYILIYNIFENISVNHLPPNLPMMLIWFDLKIFSISNKNHQFSKYNSYSLSLYMYFNAHRYKIYCIFSDKSKLEKKIRKNAGLGKTIQIYSAEKP